MLILMSLHPSWSIPVTVQSKCNRHAMDQSVGKKHHQSQRNQVYAASTFIFLKRNMKVSGDIKKPRVARFFPGPSGLSAGDVGRDGVFDWRFDLALPDHDR